MKIVETEDSFELHISSAVTDNYVVSNNKRYNYKRVVIPNVLVNFFFESNPNTKYVYLYFYDNNVFLSIEKLSEYKYSKRKLMKFKNKNSYFINLNVSSLVKHGINIDDSVEFVVERNTLLNSESNVSIKLMF